jgi:hypothetical protein
LRTETDNNNNNNNKNNNNNNKNNKNNKNNNNNNNNNNKNNKNNNNKNNKNNKNNNNNNNTLPEKIDVLLISFLAACPNSGLFEAVALMRHRTSAAIHGKLRKQLLLLIA